MRVSERIWQAPGRCYLRPFAAAVGVSARGKSRRLQRALCDCGAEHSFAQSKRRLREHDGFELNASAVREATLGHAAQVSERLRKHCAGTFRTLPRKGPAQVVAETDGSFVCTVGPGRRKGPRPRAWKEIRLSAARAQGALDAHYAAGFHSVAETGQRWGHCARDAGWALESRIHVVADGAEWIALQSREVFGDQADVLVDFYHVSEYLAAAAAVCRPASPRSWLQTQQKRLRRGKPLLVIEAMEPFAEEADTGSDDEPPVRAAIRYLRNRLRCLDYPRALARALPIGSGLIESGHKHVLQARLKKAGSAWLPANADALAQLRVLRANQPWDASWQDQRAA